MSREQRDIIREIKKSKPSDESGCLIVLLLLIIITILLYKL